MNRVRLPYNYLDAAAGRHFEVDAFSPTDSENYLIALSALSNIVMNDSANE